MGVWHEDDNLSRAALPAHTKTEFCGCASLRHRTLKFECGLFAFEIIYVRRKIGICCQSMIKCQAYVGRCQHRSIVLDLAVGKIQYYSVIRKYNCLCECAMDGMCASEKC